jgi:hypothetical protein
MVCLVLKAGSSQRALGCRGHWRCRGGDQDRCWVLLCDSAVNKGCLRGRTKATGEDAAGHAGLAHACVTSGGGPVSCDLWLQALNPKPSTSETIGGDRNECNNLIMPYARCCHHHLVMMRSTAYSMEGALCCPPGPPTSACRCCEIRSSLFIQQPASAAWPQFQDSKLIFKHSGTRCNQYFLCCTRATAQPSAYRPAALNQPRAHAPYLPLRQRQRR